MCGLRCFSCVWLYAILWTRAHQAPLSMQFFRQEYWDGLLCFPPGDPPDTGIEAASLSSPALAGGFFTTSEIWEAPWYYIYVLYNILYIILLLFSCSVESDSLRSHGLQHTRLPCSSLSPGVCSNSCPLSWWCLPTISSSIVPFFSCLQSFSASGSFPMSWSTIYTILIALICDQI